MGRSVSVSPRSSSGVLCEAAVQLLLGGAVVKLQDVARRLAERESSSPRHGPRDKGGVHLILQPRAAVLPLGVVPRVAVRGAGAPPFLGEALNPT